MKKYIFTLLFVMLISVASLSGKSFDLMSYENVVAYTSSKVNVMYSQEYIEEVIYKCLGNTTIIPYQHSLSPLVFLISGSDRIIPHILMQDRNLVVFFGFSLCLTHLPNESYNSCQ
jgi:hypothetical protein